MKAHGTRLSGVTRDLWMQWQQTRTYWRDAKADEFEHKYLSELLGSVEKTVTVIEELDKLVGRIKKDCE